MMQGLAGIAKGASTFADIGGKRTFAAFWTNDRSGRIPDIRCGDKNSAVGKRIRR